MFRLLTVLPDILASAVFLVPVFCFLHRTRLRDIRKTLWYFIFSLYLSAVYDLAGLPNILCFRLVPKCNFVPFLYMFSDWENTLLNVLLFLPFGFLLPVLWKPFRSAGTVMLAGFIASAVIETLQVFTFRATDINDLMTNTAGSLLGYFLARIWLHLFPASDRNYPLPDLWITSASVFAVMFFLQVFAADWFRSALRM